MSNTPKSSLRHFTEIAGDLELITQAMKMTLNEDTKRELLREMRSLLVEADGSLEAVR